MRTRFDEETVMTTPGYGSADASSHPGKLAAGREGGEPTNLPGQYPASLFGAVIPQGTGAPGTPGASGMADPTNEPGQLSEGLSGTGAADTANTGAPGSQGATESPGGADTVTYTRPGSFLTATYESSVVVDDVSGINDWTQAVDGSYGGGPQLPGIAGNMPTSTGAGEGRLTGGRSGYRAAGRVQ
jgi:hypothetical protein